MTVRLRVEVSGSPGAELSLAATEAHHAVQVRRLRAGDGLVVLDVEGVRWRSTLLSEAPAVVRLDAREQGDEATPSVQLAVWVPLLKGGRTDALVRQLTELGASQVVVYESASGVAKLPPAKVSGREARWATIAAEATKQCGRGDLPEVRHASTPPTSEEGAGVFFWAQEGPLWRDVCQQQAAAPERVLVGPEGGLSPSEVTTLIAQGWTSAWLGPRVLRAETAAVTAAVLALQVLREGGY